MATRLFGSMRLRWIFSLCLLSGEIIILTLYVGTLFIQFQVASCQDFRKYAKKALIR